MIIKINESLQYEVESAIKSNGKIIATKKDGTEIVIGGDLERIEVSGGEISASSQPSDTERIEELEALVAELVYGGEAV